MKWALWLVCGAIVVWILASDSVRFRAHPGPDVSAELVDTMMRFDRNGDGKLDRSEVPDRMQGMFDHADSNKDGFLTPEEIRTLARAQAQPDRR